MGVLGAFIFAAQMINFTIPAHRVQRAPGRRHDPGDPPGLRRRRFLVMASVLTVQALFFADGGLLALGANIFNLGFFPCFVAYPPRLPAGRGGEPLRRAAHPRPPSSRPSSASSSAPSGGARDGPLGSLGAPFRSPSSSDAADPPRHRAGGGIRDGGRRVLRARAQPDILREGTAGDASRKRVLAGFAVAALLPGGVLSWFASSRPDGLEWAISRITGSGEVAPPTGGVHGMLGEVQEKTALLPDYAPPPAEGEGGGEAEGKVSPAANAGTSAAGLVGGLITLASAVILGWMLRRRARPA